MPFQHLQLLAVFEADDIVGLHRFFDADGRLRSHGRFRRRRRKPADASRYSHFGQVREQARAGAVAAAGRDDRHPANVEPIVLADDRHGTDGSAVVKLSNIFILVPFRLVNWSGILIFFFSLGSVALESNDGSAAVVDHRKLKLLFSSSKVPLKATSTLVVNT